jgi:hypothetical protein
MLIGVVVLLLLVIVLLAVPVLLTFQMSWQHSFRSDVMLQWMFGLVQITLPPQQTHSAKKSATKKTSRVQRTAQPTHKKRNHFSIFWQSTFRQRIFRFIGDCWHAIHKRNISLRIAIGLGDPAETGQLWAVIGPVAGVLSNIQQVSILIEPDFAEANIELDCSGSIRVIPLQLVYLTLGLLLSPSIWRGIKQIRAGES